VTCNLAEAAFSIARFHVESVRVERADCGSDSLGELLFGRDGGEEVDVLGRSNQDSVRLDGVATREREAVSGECDQADGRQSLMKRIHWSIRRLVRGR
jgi:hypothetical protein